MARRLSKTKRRALVEYARWLEEQRGKPSDQMEIAESFGAEWRRTLSHDLAEAGLPLEEIES